MKTILVSLPGNEADERALRGSYALAAAFKSHMTCLHVRSSPARMMSSAAAGMGDPMSAGMTVLPAGLWEAIIRENAEIAQSARRNFQRFCTERNLQVLETPGSCTEVSASWEEREGDYARAVTSAGRFHDVIALGLSPARGEVLPEIGSILSASGRPLLLLPLHIPEEVLSRIVIAWKDTAEAARAVTAAMPLLQAAERVTVMTVTQSEKEEGVRESAEHLAYQLRWHGLTVSAKHIPADTLHPAEALMYAAGDIGTKLVVMGGYSHNRALEFVFGGFTRYVLGNATLPVLMSH